MGLKEYLEEELEITNEEAEKIEHALKKYKEKYGHHHHHEKKVREGHDEKKDIFSMIIENKEQCEENNYDLSKIHCNGCPHQCSLDHPNCGRGAMLQNEFKTFV